MKLSIVIIGDEILIGRVTDTNSGLIARTFTNRGWDVASVRTVGDDKNAIAGAIADALSEADLTITTGGLGPTRDDITKSVLMDIFGGTPVHNAAVMANVEKIFEQRGIEMNKLTRTQAIVPSSCRVIQNRLGTAPLMWFEKDGKVLVAMPGVPFETRGMLPEVADAADAHFHPHGHFRRASFTVYNVSESALAERLADFEDSLPECSHLAYLPSPGRIVLRLDARDMPADTFESLGKQLRSLLGNMLAGEGELTPAEIVIEALRSCSWTLATAESCTGGNIAHAITSVPGCSDVFRGSVVAYANEVKTDVLGVPAETIAEKGAVSREVVTAMAEGIRRVCGTDCAIATSGIAGPGGATDDKPVGTVWIAVATPVGSTEKLFHVPGDRTAVIEGATARALNLLSVLL